MHTKPSPGAAPLPEVDRDAPTPRISGSFSAFRDVALAVARQLQDRRAVLATRRTLFSGALLAQLDTLTAQAEQLALEFGRWPTQPPDVLARNSTIQRLMGLQEQVRSYLDGER